MLYANIFFLIIFIIAIILASLGNIESNKNKKYDLDIAAAALFIFSILYFIYWFFRLRYNSHMYNLTGAIQRSMRHGVHGY